MEKSTDLCRTKMIEFAHLIFSFTYVEREKEGRKDGCSVMESNDATIVFADDVRNEGAGIEEGRVYKGIDGRARGGG